MLAQLAAVGIAAVLAIGAMLGQVRAVGVTTGSPSRGSLPATSRGLAVLVALAGQAERVEVAELAELALDAILRQLLEARGRGPRPPSDTRYRGDNEPVSGTRQYPVPDTGRYLVLGLARWSETRFAARGSVWLP